MHLHLEESLQVGAFSNSDSAEAAMEMQADLMPHEKYAVSFLIQPAVWRVASRTIALFMPLKTSARKG